MNFIKIFFIYVFPWVLGGVYFYYEVEVKGNKSFNGVAFLAFVVIFWFFRLIEFLSKKKTKS